MQNRLSSRTLLWVQLFAYAQGGLLFAGCEMQPLDYGQVDASEQSAYIRNFDFEEPLNRQQLPGELREISGVVALSGSNLLAHHDNSSTIWLLDSSGVNPPRVYLQPRPLIKGDFEDITITQETIYLTDSHGTLVHTPLPQGITGSADDDAKFVTTETAVKDRCNFEGLAASQSAGEVFLACKYLKYAAQPNIHLYKILLQDPQGDADLTVVDVAAILRTLKLPRLRPSALHWLQSEDRMLILAGKEHVLLEVDRAGKVVAWQRLRRDLHRQAEGLTVNGAGQIVIADEADGRKPMLTVYGPLER